MTGNLFRVLFIVVMISVIVSVDLLFLRHHFTATTNRQHWYSRGVCHRLFHLFQEVVNKAMQHLIETSQSDSGGHWGVAGLENSRRLFENLKRIAPSLVEYLSIYQSE